MDANITDVYFVNDQVGYAVDGGDYGKTFKTINGGQYWVELANTLNPLYAIHMLNEDSGFAVGNDLGFYNTTNGGASWSGTTASSIQNGMDVYYTEWNNGYVVGDHGYGGYGYFSHYDPNANVNDYTNEYSFDLFAIDFYGTRGVVVGEYSVLIPYEEGELGGIFWENMLAPDGTTIQFTYKDVVFADQSTFYAVGNDGVITRFQYPE